MRKTALCFSVLFLAAGSAQAMEDSSVADNIPKGLRLGVKIASCDGGGVEIREVFDGYPAREIGLAKGYVIHSVDGNLFDDAHQMRNYVMAKPGNNIDLIYQSGTDFIQVKARLVTKTKVVEIFTGPGSRPRFERIKTQTWEVESRKKVGDPRRK